MRIRTAEPPLRFRTDVASLLLLVGGIGAFGAALARSFSRLANALTWNADLVSPMVIADTVASTSGPHDVVFGTYAPYTSMWFNVLTRRLPFHREIWETAPLVLSLIGVSLLVLASWQLAGRWAALATLVVGLAWSQPVLVTLVAQAIHGTTYFVVCLLAAFLVLVAGRPRALGTTVAATVAVGIVAGVNLASDTLLLIVGIAPLVGAPLLAALRSWSTASRRALVVAAGAGAIAVVVGMGSASGMEATGYRAMGVSTGSPLTLASLPGIVDNASRLLENLLDIWSADFVGEAVGPITLFRVVLAVPALAAVGLTVVLLARALRYRISPGGGEVQRLYVLYWGLVVALLLPALLFSQLAVDNADRAVNYLTPVVLAVAATLPIVASRARWSRLVVGIGAGLLCALSTVDLLWPPGPQPGVPALAYVAEGPTLLATLERHGLKRGYSGYVSASVYTYQSSGRLTVRPVFPCLLAPDRPSVCGFFANRVESWFVPVPVDRTFLVTDPSLPAGVPSAPAELGAPSEVIPIGVQTVYVYPYDIATRFGPTY